MSLGTGAHTGVWPRGAPAPCFAPSSHSQLCSVRHVSRASWKNSWLLIRRISGRSNCFPPADSHISLITFFCPHLERKPLENWGGEIHSCVFFNKNSPFASGLAQAVKRASAPNLRAHVLFRGGRRLFCERYSLYRTA